jgi:hypothetical protein
MGDVPWLLGFRHNCFDERAMNKKSGCAAAGFCSHQFEKRSIADRFLASAFG